MRKITILLLQVMCCYLHAHPQVERPPLIGWQVIGDLQLTQPAAFDRNIEVIFADHLLLIGTPNTDNGQICGEVLVYSISAPDAPRLEQVLSVEDFGQTCEGNNSFGFSMDYVDNLLVIGAPGKLFVDIENESLSAGSVYTYRLEGERFVSESEITGPNTDDNLAFGTLVQTDGEQIIVQGNNTGSLAISRLPRPRGNAVPRSVNLLVNEGSEWVLARQFTEPQFSMYGQDFELINGSLIIAQHILLNPVRLDANVRSNLLIYKQPLTDLEPSQTISRLNEFFGLTSLNYIDSHDNVFTTYNKNSRFVELISTFGLNDAGLWELLSEDIIRTTNSNEPTQGFGSNSSAFTQRNTNGIHGLSFQAGNLTLTNRRLATHVTGSQNAPIDQVQQIVGVNTSDGISTIRTPVVGSNNLAIVSSRFNREAPAFGEFQISVFTAKPALDPALTQAWWFGPDFNGQGITLEVLGTNRLLMHWFTFGQNGQQMWLRGVGELNNGEVNMSLITTRGPRFSDYNSSELEVIPWGEATLTFSDCRSGQLSYRSDTAGNGSLAIFPLEELEIDCNSGNTASDDALSVGNLNRAVGSYYDSSRIGEGLILMPLPRSSCGLTSDSSTVLGEGETLMGNACRLVLMLTYDAVGNQRWMFLGAMRTCENNPGPIDGLPSPDGFSGFTISTVTITCNLVGLSTPVIAQGGTLGSANQPGDVDILPWFTPTIFQERGGNETPVSEQALIFSDFVTVAIIGLRTSINLRLSNPDGLVELNLERLTRPTGY